MSIALVVTRGFGNGTLTGTVKDVVTRGYTISGEVVDYFLGSGILMYSKDENYYILNTTETSPTTS